MTSRPLGATLFPPSVIYECVRFCEADQARFGNSALPEQVARAVPKRRLEFAAGRHCARLALGRLAAELGLAPLPIGPHRAPVWPTGTLGAITHTDRFAAAAVVRTEDALGIGLDTEVLLTGAAMKTVGAEVATPAELRALEASGNDPVQALTTVFSAKESIFKCLYPRVGRYFDFHDVRIVEIDGAAQRFTAELQVGLGGLTQGTLLEGRFAISDGLMHTGILLLSIRGSS